MLVVRHDDDDDDKSYIFVDGGDRIWCYMTHNSSDAIKHNQTKLNQQISYKIVHKLLVLERNT